MKMTININNISNRNQMKVGQSFPGKFLQLSSILGRFPQTNNETK